LLPVATGLYLATPVPGKSTDAFGKGGSLSGKWLVVVGMLAGCAPQAAPVGDAGSGSPPGLGSSMNVRVVADTVVLEIHVTNVAASPIVLEFGSTQRYDFEIATAAGEALWRWSAARSFAQVVEQETLQPGETRRYSATWVGEGREGEFIASGWVVSSSHPVELRTGFRLPADQAPATF
jgi:hypothetical protein